MSASTKLHRTCTGLAPLAAWPVFSRQKETPGALASGVLYGSVWANQPKGPAPCPLMRTPQKPRMPPWWAPSLNRAPSATYSSRVDKRSLLPRAQNS